LFLVVLWFLIQNNIRLVFSLALWCLISLFALMFMDKELIYFFFNAQTVANRKLQQKANQIRSDIISVHKCLQDKAKQMLHIVSR
jgi:hypothetical protein